MNRHHAPARSATRLWLGALAIAAFTLAALARAGETEPAADPSAIYQKAVTAFYKSDYAAAREGFAELIRGFPESPFTRDSVYKTAESYYRESQPELAGGYYALYLQRYPLGVNARDARTRLAECEQKAGHTLAAIKPESPMRVETVIAAWADSLPFGDADALRRGLAQLGAAGVNTIIVAGSTRPGQGPHALAANAVNHEGVYFPSTHAPLVADVVKAVAAAAHGLRLRVFVTLSLREASWWTAEHEDQRDVVWDRAERKVLRGGRLDLFHADVPDELAGLVTDLCRAPADGIILRDAMIREDEGLSDAAAKAFEQSAQLTYTPAEFFGESAPGEPLALTEPYAAFARVKAERVTAVAKKLVEAARKANPSIPVYLELDPMTLTSPADALARRGQEIEVLSPIPDGFVVAAPWRDLATGQGLSGPDRPKALEAISREAAGIQPDGRRWIIALPVVEETSGHFYPAWELDAALNAARSGLPAGVALFPTRLDFPYNERLESLVKTPTGVHP